MGGALCRYADFRAILRRCNANWGSFLKHSSSPVQCYHDYISIMITSYFSDPCIALFYQFVPQFFGISRKVQEDGSKVLMLMNDIFLDFSYLYSRLYCAAKLTSLFNLKLKQFKHPEHQFLGFWRNLVSTWLESLPTNDSCTICRSST